jgi:hypothetical protein
MRYDSEGECVAVRVGSTALLALLLVAAGASSVLYVIPLTSDDEGAMRLANGSLPALIATNRSPASAR